MEFIIKGSSGCRLKEVKKTYQKLQQQVKEGFLRRYWLDNDLLYAKGGRLYVPSCGGLRRELLRERHDRRAIQAGKGCWLACPADVAAYLVYKNVAPVLRNVSSVSSNCIVCLNDGLSDLIRILISSVFRSKKEVQLSF